MFAQTISFKRVSLFFSAVLLLVVLIMPSVAMAQEVGKLCRGADLSFGDNPATSADDEPCKVKGGTETAESNLGKLVTNIINIISIIVGVAAVIMVIYGGFRFVTSAGNPEGTKAGRNAILYAIIGLIIVAFAQLIVKFVLTKL